VRAQNPIRSHCIITTLHGQREPAASPKDVRCARQLGCPFITQHAQPRLLRPREVEAYRLGCHAAGPNVLGGIPGDRLYPPDVSSITPPRRGNGLAVTD